MTAKEYELTIPVRNYFMNHDMCLLFASIWTFCNLVYNAFKKVLVNFSDLTSYNASFQPFYS